MAIVMVSFFGLKIEAVVETKYIERIECINENLYITDEYKYIIVDYYNDPDNPLAVQLEWHIYPDDASKKLVTFEYDEDSKVASVTMMGTVVIHNRGTITVYITAADGSGVMEVVKIIAK